MKKKYTIAPYYTVTKYPTKEFGICEHRPEYRYQIIQGKKIIAENFESYEAAEEYLKDYDNKFALEVLKEEVRYLKGLVKRYASELKEVQKELSKRKKI